MGGQVSALYCVIQWLVLLGAAFPAAPILARRKESRFLGSFALIIIFGAVWAVGQHAKNTLYYFYPHEGLFTVATGVCYLGMCALGPACVYMAWCYTGKHQHYRSPKKVGALFGTGAVFFLLVLTTHWHRLYYTAFSLHDKAYGPAFYLFTVWSYICFIYTGYTMQRASWTAFGKSSLSYMITILPPVLANTWGMVAPPAWDFTPIAYCLTIVGVWLNVSVYWPIHIAPLAAERVFEGMDYPVAICDAAGNPLYHNRQAAHFLPLLTQAAPPGQLERDGRLYAFEARPLGDGNVLNSFTDLTAHHQALALLDKENAALAESLALLRQQTDQLTAYAQTAKETAAAKRRMEIMTRLSREEEEMLYQLEAEIKKAMVETNDGQIEQCQHLAVAATNNMRHIVSEYRERYQDGF